MRNQRKVSKFATTYLPRFPQEQRAQGKSFFLPMSTQTYNQPQIPVEEQIRLLKSKGLSFLDEERSEHLLQHISLFRMKSYLKPLRVCNSRNFKAGSTFEEAYNTYKFDAELRKMVCSELEKIEVSVRTQLSLTMGTAFGIYWFQSPENFRDRERHSTLLRNLADEFHRSDDEAIATFQRDYSNLFPPSWMVFEISSFGTLSMMYRNLNPSQARRKFARFYGLSDTIMQSWLHAIVYIRNICAHHSPLWNRKLNINAMIPRHTKLSFIAIPSDTKKVYYMLSVILYFLQTVNPQNTFANRFKALLEKYPHIDVSTMGFPYDWQLNLLWQ